MRASPLSALVLIVGLSAACGIRTPAQQCQIAEAREVACGQLAAEEAAAAKASCEADLTASTMACQHAYDALVGCLDNFSCYDLQSGACDDLYGNAAPLCPLMFGNKTPASAAADNSNQPAPR